MSMQQAYGYGGSSMLGYSGAYSMAAGKTALQSICEATSMCTFTEVICLKLSFPFCAGYGGPAGAMQGATLSVQGAAVRGGPVSQVSTMELF